MTRKAPLVLIVDDNAKSLKLTRDVLGAAGFRTLETATAGEGLASAIENHPDVILMDIHLPDMEGDEAARRLKNDPRTRDIPLLAFTALAPRANRGWLLDSGFDGYLEKPFSVADLPAQVRRYCV